MKELIPDNAHLHNWLDMARARIKFQGLPARICWVGLGDRHRLGLAFNEMVAKGEVKAPIVIGRDHLDSGSVASPNRETEAMKDGSDAVSDWPMLNALLNCASGATWVSLHHGGGVGMGFSQHAGVVIVCDGTPEAARRIERVLWNDPATGVMRHADAGYEIAIECAREKGLDLPSLEERAPVRVGAIAGQERDDFRPAQIRHRERSEAIQGPSGALRPLDRRVASLLAMTAVIQPNRILSNASFPASRTSIGKAEIWRVALDGVPRRLAGPVAELFLRRRTTSTRRIALFCPVFREITGAARERREISSRKIPCNVMLLCECR